jgi:hypothetical protein
MLAPAAKRTMVSMLAATLAVAVLALTTAEAPGSSMRIFWRYALLSFDNPATQLLDEMASASSGVTDAGAGAQTIGRLPLASRLVPGPAAPPLQNPALSSRLTRSPPAA